MFYINSSNLSFFMMNVLTIFAIVLVYQIQNIKSQLNSPTLISAAAAQSEIGPVADTNETVNDVLKFGTNIINTLSEKINTLPAGMRPAGQNILADTKEGLKSCENAFMQSGIAWEYKVCCSTYLKYGMKAFGKLAAESYRSGAVGKPFLTLFTLVIATFLSVLI